MVKMLKWAIRSASLSVASSLATSAEAATVAGGWVLFIILFIHMLWLGLTCLDRPEQQGLESAF